MDKQINQCRICGKPVTWAELANGKAISTEYNFFHIFCFDKAYPVENGLQEPRERRMAKPAVKHKTWFGTVNDELETIRYECSMLYDLTADLRRVGLESTADRCITATNDIAAAVDAIRQANSDMIHSKFNASQQAVHETFRAVFASLRERYEHDED